MASYIVTFEIKDATKLAPFKEGLKSYGGYCPINENTWAITTPNTAAQVRDHLSTLIDPSDRLFVIRSGVEAAWRNAISEKHTEWLKKYL